MAGRFAAAERLGQDLAPPPPTTAHGALLAHITGGADASTFQPMNVNFGLFPPLTPPEGKRKVKKKDRKPAYSARALADLDAWHSRTATAAE
jgi:methylenetetrahydrofolate--tRNA-(uracil-5-)-methyltransferase